MDLRHFFAGQHAAAHAPEVYDGRTTGSDRVFGGLTDAQMRVRPGPGLNSGVSPPGRS